MPARPRHGKTLAVLGMAFLACTTAYHTRHARGPAGEDAGGADVAHCLASLGLEDESQEGLLRQFIEEEPELRAIWGTPGGSIWSTTSGVDASVRREEDRWHVLFVPATGGGGSAAEMFADGFARCIALHAPGTPVEIEPQRFLDLR